MEKIIKYEDAASYKTYYAGDRWRVDLSVPMISRWVCNTCCKDYQSEDSARRCCATDVPCSGKTCNNRLQMQPSKHYITAIHFCQECKEQERQERKAKMLTRWQAREKRPWDGKTMIFSDSDDKFFQDLDELCDYYQESLEDDAISSIDDLQLRICQPIGPPHFEMFEFLADCLPDEDDFHHLPEGYEEIEKIVNDFTSAQTFSWEPGPYALEISDEDLSGEFYPSATNNYNDKYVSPFDGTAK